MLLRLILVAPAVSINQATNDNTPPVAHHYLELRAAGTLIRFTWWRVGRILGKILWMAEELYAVLLPLGVSVILDHP
jgi:hypothetical protein